MVEKSRNDNNPICTATYLSGLNIHLCHLLVTKLNRSREDNAVPRVKPPYVQILIVPESHTALWPVRFAKPEIIKKSNNIESTQMILRNASYKWSSVPRVIDIIPWEVITYMRLWWATREQKKVQIQSNDHFGDNRRKQLLTIGW